MIGGGLTFTEMAQNFLRGAEAETPTGPGYATLSAAPVPVPDQERAVSPPSPAPESCGNQPGLGAPDAPTDAEYLAAWRESIDPMFDPTCGCGEEGCAR